MPAKGARAALVLLLTINLFNYIDRYILAAVEPEIRKHFFPESVSPTTGPVTETSPGAHQAAMAKTGGLATAFLVSYMIAAPIFGWLADRMSRWLLVGISVAVWSLASGASGLATTFGLLLLTRCFVGIGEAGYGPAAPTIISDMYPAARRGAVLAWFYMAIPVGSALGYALGGLINKYWGWRAPFFAVVVPGLILAVLCWFMKEPQPPAGLPVVKREKAKLGDYLRILKIPSYLLDSAGMTAMTFAIGGISFWMPAYLVGHARAGSLADVNIYFGGIVVVAGLTATLAGGWLGDYFRRHTSGSYFIVSAVGILISAGCLVMMTRSSFTGGALSGGWVWLFLAVFFLFLNTGPSNTILANVTMPAVRASAFALNILLIHALGDAISPPILGGIVEASGSWNAAMYTVAGVMVVAGVLWLWGAAYLGRDTEVVERAERRGA